MYNHQTTSKIKVILSNLHRETITAAQATQEMIAILAEPPHSLTYLYLGHTDIGSDGAQALAGALKDPHCKLEILDPSGSNIGDAGAQALAQALIHPHCKLTHLHLSGNYIASKGAQAIAQALIHPNCKLISLSLGHNYIGLESAQALAQALIHPNCTLTYLHLSGNDTGSDGEKALADAALACAQKGRLITITGAYSSEQAQQIQETYNEVVKLLQCHQRLAWALVLRTRAAAEVPYDLLPEIATAHNSIHVQPDVTKRFSAERAAAHTTPSIKQCLLSLGLGLATGAFIAHAFGVTGSTESILSTPFAMSLTVGAFVTRLAFCAASSCRPVCLPNTQTAASSKTPLSALTAVNTEPVDPSGLQATPSAADNTQPAAP